MRGFLSKSNWSSEFSSEMSVSGSEICVPVCFRISMMSRGCFRRVSGPRVSLLRPWLSTPEQGSQSLWLPLRPRSPSTTRWVCHSTRRDSMKSGLQLQSVSASYLESWKIWRAMANCQRQSCRHRACFSLQTSVFLTPRDATTPSAQTEFCSAAF